jgi:hypothetical protein
MEPIQDLLVMNAHLDAPNHVFPRPCGNPSDLEVFEAAGTLYFIDYYAQNTRRGDLNVIRPLNTLINAFHGDAVASGWHHDIATGAPKKRDMGEMFMLAVSELAEAMEGHRKNLRDDKLPQYPTATVELADFIIRCCDTMNMNEISQVWGSGFVNVALTRPENFGSSLLDVVGSIVAASQAVRDEMPRRAMDCLQDAVLTAFTMARLYGLDLPPAIVAKRIVNRNRADHSVAARLESGGKQY